MDKYILLFFFLFSMSTKAQTYIGNINYSNTSEYLKITCKNDSCLLSLPYVEPSKTILLPLDFLATGNAKIAFGLDSFFLNTQIVNKEIIGTLSISNESQNLVLIQQVFNLKPEELLPYLGVYESKSGKRAIIYERFNYLHYISPFSELVVSLKEIKENHFWSVTGETSTFELKKNDQFQIIKIKDLNGKEHSFHRINSPIIEELFIPIGKDTIYAQLYRPKSKSKVPACLILPGGGAIGIDNYISEARFLASNGIASLVFEKPGNGKSKGETDFRLQSFEEKINTYKELFKFLREHPSSDKSKIGIHGPSEGGRLALMMASDLKEKVAFVIGVSAPLMTMQEGQFYAMNQHHRIMQVEEIDNMNIQFIWKAYYDGIRKGKIDSTTIEKALSYLEKNPRLFLPRHYEVPSSPRSEDLLNNRVLLESNQITCPIFLQYGENDTRVNAAKSISNFSKNYLKDFDFKIYRRGNHSIMTPEFKICTGYLHDKIKWLKNIKIITS